MYHELHIQLHQFILSIHTFISIIVKAKGLQKNTFLHQMQEIIVPHVLGKQVDGQYFGEYFCRWDDSFLALNHL